MPLDLLHAEGVSPSELKRLNAPIGLDIGAATPQETAISITAEIIAHIRGRPGMPLVDSSGPIHPRTSY